MQTEEARELLKQVKAARRRALAIKQSLLELESDIAALSSPLGRVSIRSQPQNSVVENAYFRVEKRREDFAEALIRVYELEDKLQQAISKLTPIEQEIITGFYMKDKTNYQLARGIGYSVRSIKYIKAGAIEKIAKSCEDL